MNRHRKLESYNFSEDKQKIKKILNYFKYWNGGKHERTKKTDLWGRQIMGGKFHEWYNFWDAYPIQYFFVKVLK